MSDTRDLARVQWDGDPSGWQDYVRKARLARERTRKRNRRHLGPELAAQLSMDDHPGVGPPQADAAQRRPVPAGVLGDSPRQGSCARRRIESRGVAGAPQASPRHEHGDMVLFGQGSTSPASKGT